MADNILQGVLATEREPVASLSLGTDGELLVYDRPPVDPRLETADLFNAPKYFALHAGAFSAAYYFVARHSTSLEPFAVAQCAEVEPGHFRSPGRGSYGGIEPIASKPDIAVIEKLVEAIEAFLCERGAATFTIVLPPVDYHPGATSLVTHVLLRAGFRIVGHELNYAVPVSGGSLLARVDHGNRKRIQGAPRFGLRFYHLPSDALPEAYAVVAENRAKRGYVLSMSLEGLQAMDRALPGRVRCFGVRQNETLVAAAVCVAVNAQVLYVFYWGEIVGAERLSPVSYLASEIYVVCVREDRRLLDIGTSTLGGVPNYGLIRFKKNLGCQESMKLTLAKALVGAVPG